MGLFELVLEVADLAASERFYREVIGLAVADRWDSDRPAVWLSLGREAFLGLWPVASGGENAIHGGRGGSHVHYALRVPHGTLAEAQRRVEHHGLDVERREFGPGDHAIYVNDPDGNVLELTERTTLWDGSAAIDDSRKGTAMPAVDGQETSRAVHILGLGGSMRPNSKSCIALEQAMRLAAEAGAETTLVSVRDVALPVYDPTISDAEQPPALQQVLDQVRRADAFIFCSPTYHGTISGAVKNMLDALNGLAGDEPRYLGGKPVGLLALGGGSAMNTINALDHAARGLNSLTTTMPVIVPGNAIDEITRRVTDEAVLSRLGMMVEDVLDLGSRLRCIASDRLALVGD